VSQQHNLQNGRISQVADLEEKVYNNVEQKVVNRILKNRQQVETRGDGNCLFYSLLGCAKSQVTKNNTLEIKEYRSKIATFIRTYPPVLLEKWEMLLCDIQDEKSKFKPEEWQQVQEALSKCHGTGVLQGDDLKLVQKQLCDLYALILCRGNTFGANIVTFAFSLMESKPVVVVEEYPKVGFKLLGIYPTNNILDNVNLAYNSVIVLNRVLVPREDGTYTPHYRFFIPNSKGFINTDMPEFNQSIDHFKYHNMKEYVEDDQDTEYMEDNQHTKYANNESAECTENDSDIKKVNNSYNSFDSVLL
jgi:hypothetical protein